MKPTPKRKREQTRQEDGYITVSKTIFYARVSTRDQNPALQIDAAKKLGKSRNRSPSSPLV